jgi:hypothetical protein
MSINYLFGCSNFPTSSTTVRTALKLAGQSGRQFEVNWIFMGGGAATNPQDFMYQCQVGWISNATIGTPGSVTTPIKLDYTAQAATNSCGIAYTAEPTAYDSYVVPLFSHNQRGGMIFQVPPGDGFISDPASAYGFGVRVLSNTPGNIDASMKFSN